MSDFLSNLIARSFTDAPVIQPRLPSLFETAADEISDERQSSTPAMATSETIAPKAPLAVALKSPPASETSKTSIANVSDARGEESVPKPGPPAREKAPVSAQGTHADKQPAEVRKLEIETKRIIVPVDSFRDGKKDARYERSPSEPLSEPHPIQPGRRKDFSRVEPRPIQVRRRKDFSPVERQSSTSAPIIRVTIGRVEVRAIHPPAPPPKPAKPSPPKLSLDEYLRGGKR